MNRGFNKVKALVSFQNADKTITGNILQVVLNVRDSMPHEDGISSLCLRRKIERKVKRDFKKNSLSKIVYGEQTPSSAFCSPALSAQLTGGKRYSRAFSRACTFGTIASGSMATWVRFPCCGNLPASLRKLPNITWGTWGT